MNKENKHNTILKIIIFGLFILTIFFTIRVLVSSKSIKNSMTNDIKKEAKAIKNYILASRKVYQEEFLKNSNELDDKSLHFLPARVSNEISKEFTSMNEDGYYVRSVSDKPINQKNLADKEELKSIEYFKKNAAATDYLLEYLEDEKKFYQYASPLYINSSCLACHGEKEQTLDIIQKNYDNAYGYKLGDLRGVISIKIPKEIYNQELDKFISEEIIFSLTSLFIISVILYLLYKTTFKEITKIDKDATEYAHTDALTGLYNRHYLSYYIDTFDPLEREDNRFAIAFIDIDHFKDVNDIYGHIAGDNILKELALKFTELTRQNDVVCRYGGEEFLIIMREISEDTAYKKIDTMREIISDITFESINKCITISVGISVGTENDDISEIIDESDKALYMAKEAGRNCVKVFSHYV